MKTILLTLAIASIFVAANAEAQNYNIIGIYGRATTSWTKIDFGTRVSLQGITNDTTAGTDSMWVFVGPDTSVIAKSFSGQVTIDGKFPLKQGEAKSLTGFIVQVMWVKMSGHTATFRAEARK